MSSNKAPKQVSLSGAAMGGNSKKGKKPSSGKKKGRIIALISVMVVLIGVVVGVLVFRRGGDGPSLTAREFVEYTYTPDEQLKDVSYYALGISGAKLTDQLDMMALLCFDRENDKLSVVQVPVASYVEGNFAVQTAGDIWGNPKPLTWCATCRCAVAADDISGDAHALCGTRVDSRSGSASTSFAAYFNSQLGLPVDNYLVIPRAGLVTLIDAVGGVTLDVQKAFQYNEVDYAVGAGTLPGDAAVYYATQWGYDGSPASDLERMQRQRQLFAALFSRLSTYDRDELYNDDPSRKDILSNVMAGKAPIRMDTTGFGKSRLLGKKDDSATENMRYMEALARFVHTVCAVEPENVTCSVLPGEAAKKNGATVYSIHKDVTVEMLKTQMNPAGLLNEAAVDIVEVAHKGKSDAKTATLDTFLIPQVEAEQKTEE